MIANGRKWNYAVYVKIILPHSDWRGLEVEPNITELSPLICRHLYRLSVVSPFCSGIIILTYALQSTGDAHGRAPRPQEQGPEAAWNAESQAPAGSRSSLPGQRVFRSARPCPGEVRDASPRAGRGDVGDGGGQGVRLLAGGVLPGLGGLSASGAGGPAPAAPRAQEAPQAHRRCSAIPRRLPGRRPHVAGANAGAAGSGALGIIGASPQHRAGLGAEGKKGATDRPVVEPDAPEGTWTRRYEDLRLAARDPFGAGRWGLALFTCRGFAAWMRAYPQQDDDPPNPRRPSSTAAPAQMPTFLTGPLVTILANMIFTARQEVLT